MKLLVNFELTT